MKDLDQAASHEISGAVDALLNKLHQELGAEIAYAAEHGVAISLVITAPMPSGDLFTALRSNASPEMLSSISRAFASAAEKSEKKCTSPGGVG